MKEEYLTSIIRKLDKCNDLALLDLIDGLLDKCVQEAA